jgi:hypothetical protein
MGAFDMNLLPQSSTLKIEAGCTVVRSIYIYQNTRLHISEGPDVYTAGRRRRLEDILQAILKK